MNDYILNLMGNLEDNIEEVCNTKNCKRMNVDKFYRENKAMVDYLLFNFLEEKLYRKGVI